MESNLKKIPPYHVGKVEGLGDCWAPNTVCPTILLEWLEDSWVRSKRLPLLEAVGGAATLAWADDHHQDAHIPAMGVLWSVAMVQPQWLSPISEYGIQYGTWK